MSKQSREREREIWGLTRNENEDENEGKCERRNLQRMGKQSQEGSASQSTPSGIMPRQSVMSQTEWRLTLTDTKDGRQQQESFTMDRHIHSPPFSFEKIQLNKKVSDLFAHRERRLPPLLFCLLEMSSLSCPDVSCSLTQHSKALFSLCVQSLPLSRATPGLPSLPQWFTVCMPISIHTFTDLHYMSFSSLVLHCAMLNETRFLSFDSGGLLPHSDHP